MASRRRQPSPPLASHRGRRCCYATPGQNILCLFSTGFQRREVGLGSTRLNPQSCTSPPLASFFGFRSFNLTCGFFVLVVAFVFISVVLSLVCYVPTSAGAAPNTVRQPPFTSCFGMRSLSRIGFSRRSLPLGGFADPWIAGWFFASTAPIVIILRANRRAGVASRLPRKSCV